MNRLSVPLSGHAGRRRFGPQRRAPSAVSKTELFLLLNIFFAPSLTPVFLGYWLSAHAA
jgi:hypothetical protein